MKTFLGSSDPAAVSNLVELVAVTRYLGQYKTSSTDWYGSNTAAKSWIKKILILHSRNKKKHR